jgi:thioredoxin 1
MTNVTDVKKLDDRNFQTEIGAGPTLVDFSAVHCGPCRALRPTIEALARDLRGRVTVAEVDVDDSPVTAERYGIRAMPTLLVFKGGEVVGQIVGAVPRAKIEGLIAKIL